MRTREIMREARKDGAAAGRAAASWVFDGNTKDATYREVLKGIEDGDPEVMDRFRTPDLSGEWTDEPTPRTRERRAEVRDFALGVLRSIGADIQINSTDDDVLTARLPEGFAESIGLSNLTLGTCERSVETLTL